MVQKTKSKPSTPAAPPEIALARTLTPNEQAAEESRNMLAMYRMALINNLQPFEMIRFLIEHMVIDADRAKEIRRGGKGDKVATCQAILDELTSRGAREYGVFQLGLRKQNVVLLADLLEQKHESYLINFLEPASKKLGHHWKRLSIELGTAGLVTKVEIKYSSIREQALYSLLLWEDTSGIAATERRLLDAFQALKMKRAINYLKKLSNPKSGKKKRGKKSSGKRKK